ncbi:hypothetical protein [Rhizobium leguminosarum]|uniref:hypothetical protein n=1 Tax=Rhizobium leguminosarum TaxID=384 RepID=UPI0015BA92A3|nr:hypothetical protein [Rhizobium leguminosarum]
MISPPKIMTLVGYERLTEEPTGFCTGLYSVKKENQTFVPIASVEGSANSTVAGFRPVSPRTPHWLDGTEGSFLLAAGDPWADVLLVNDKLHFGTRPQLRTALDGKLDELYADYPFTAVALLSDVSGSDRREAVKAAYQRVSKVFDVDHAEAWATETYFRDQVLSHLRRKLIARNASPIALEAVRHIQVLRERGENKLIVTMPGSFELDPSDVGPLLALGDDREALSLASELPGDLGALSLRGRLADGKLVSHYRPKPILLIPFGKTAGRICAMIMEEGGVPRFLVDANWPRRLFEQAHSAVVNFPGREQYSLAVAVVDDDMVGHGVIEFDILQSIIRGHGDIPLLVAPTLPDRGPSRSLTVERQFPIFEHDLRHMLLDTSAARTSLYVGNRSTTIARRTSLLIEQACLLMLQRPDYVDRFARAVRGERDLCLTLSFQKDDDGFLADRFFPTEAASRNSKSFSVRAPMRLGENKSRQRLARKGVYELASARLRSEGISDLAVAVIGDVLRQRNINPDDLIKSERHVEIPGLGLKFPDLTAGIEVEIAPDARLLVLAESPTLETLVVAENHGYHAVRYTDTSTLRRLLFDEARPGWRWTIPDDIVPVASRLDLETTSVFSRPSQNPGFLVPAKDWSEWLNAFPTHPLATRARAIIPTVASGRKAGGLLVALNHRDVANAARLGGDAWDALYAYGSPLNPPHYGINHLSLSESVEEPNVERWAFRLTSPSIVPRLLPTNCAVGDGWFVFDGDIFSAAVVASKVFSAWIRANAPQVNGPARQADRLLNSFPWPDNFNTTTQNAIVCISPTTELEAACAALELPVLAPDFVEPSNRSAERYIGSTYGDQLTSAVLGLYGIRDTSSEIEAITRICDHYGISYRNRPD